MPRTAKLQNRDLLTTRAKPKTASPFGGVHGTPKAPIGLLPATRAAWAQFWGMTELTRYLSEADVPSVDRLFELRDQAQRMKRLIKKQGLINDEGKAHPLISKLVTVEGAIGRLEDRLLLSPRARAAAGVQFDAKRSADDYFESTLEDS
jgi:phage terminase small subunit